MKCARDTFRQKLRHQFPNFNSLFDAATMIIILMHDDDKDNDDDDDDDNYDFSSKFSPSINQKVRILV